MKLEFRQTVTCNHLTLARVCKTIDWQQPLPRCCLLYTSDVAELPGFNIAQLRLSYRELEQLAAKKGWTLQKL